jgi:HTH-type transcriptional regulator/antitoxin MqsA
MTCEVCDNTTFHAARVSQGYNVDGRLCWVEDIPAEICDRCGEANFTAEIAESLRKLVRAPNRAGRLVQAEVLHFQAA